MSKNQSPSAALEDYIKIIYKLNEDKQVKESVSTTDIAGLLKVSSASVSAMLKKLAAQDYILLEPYHGAQLTELGKALALKMIRRHRIIETYLVDRLKYGWDEVNAEAEILEHAVSDKLVNHMWAALGKPTQDPHGAPIPDERGEIVNTERDLLTDAAIGDQVKIIWIRNKSPEELRYFSQIGIKLDTLLTIIDKQPFKGPITLRIDTETRTIDHTLSQSIFVSKPLMD